MSRPRKASILLATAVLSLSFGMLSMAATESGGAWPDIDPAERALKEVSWDPGAAAVILRHTRDGRVVRKGNDTVNVLEYHWRIKILNDRGRRYADVQIPAGKYSRVHGIEARTIRPDGTVVPVPDDRVYEKVVLRARGFRMNAFVFTFPAVEPGAILEYRYQNVVDNYIFIAPWSFTGPIPTLVSRVSQAVPLGAIYGVLCHHCPQTKPETSLTRDGAVRGHRYTWEVRELPAVPEEEWMPPERVHGTRLEMVLKAWADAYWPSLDRSTRFFTDWGSVARHAGFFYDLAVEEDRAPLRAAVKEWTAGLTEPAERIRSLTRHVQRDLRYLPSDEVYGVTRSIAAILKAGTADNEEKGVLLAAALRAAGLKANIALVAGRDRGPMYENFFSLSEFSHAIVLARLPDGSEIWIDPTVTYAPFGFLPWRDSGAAALLIEGRSGKIVGLPDVSDTGLTRHDSRLRALADGRAELEADILLQGEDAVEMREILLPTGEAERRETVREWLEEARPGLTMGSLEFGELEELDKPLHIKVKAVVPDIVTLTEDAIAVRPCVFGCYESNPLSRATRTHPFFVDRGMLRVQAVTVLPPEGAFTAILPPEEQASSAIGAVTFGCASKATGEVECLRALTLPRSRVPASEAEGVRGMFEKIVGIDRAAVVFTARDGGGPAARADD